VVKVAFWALRTFPADTFDPTSRDRTHLGKQ